MKELIIHIGTQKTDTTTIQKMLSDMAGELLTNHGILYPNSGKPETNFENQYGHHILAWSILKKKILRINHDTGV